MFPRVVMYFREPSKGCTLGTETGLERYDARLLEELVRALEVARSRLAVTAAADNKKILPEQRRIYSETDGEVRSLVMRLRSCRRLARPCAGAWVRGLVHLRDFIADDAAMKGGSLRMCVRLREILRLLDGTADETNCRSSDRHADFGF